MPCACMKGQGGGTQEWKHALVILPYISVVAEKTAHLADILRSTGCACKGFYGHNERGTPLRHGCTAAPYCLFY